MTKFTLSLLTAVAVGGMSAGDALATDLVEGAVASPKVIATSRTNTPAEKGRALRKPAKKQRANSLIHKAPARFAATAEENIIYSCSFDFLTEGSETDPVELELDDWDNIPEEIIGEENYGFGGQGLMQAGGAVYVPFEYDEDPDSDFPWIMEGMLWTPDIYEPMEVIIELDVKIVPGCGVETDELWVYASDYTYNFDEDSGDISTEWTHLSLKIDAKDFVPESDDDSYYFTLFADGGADIVIKNVVVKGQKAELQIPIAQEYTDYTGTSFTANWSEVEGATGYYLTVYNFDIDTKANTSIYLDAQYVEGNSYDVTGLTPGNFYSYTVAATNGSFTTGASNCVLVCELPAPDGVTLTAGNDNNSLNVNWTATAGANYYVLTVNSAHPVVAGQTIMLADADFSGITSSGTVAEPEESDYWFESMPQLPGWQFNLGCSAPGAYGFWDNSYYTAITGLLASLGSMDYDLSNIKGGMVNVNIEAASPGNGLLAGLLTFNAETNKYEVASAFGTTENVPEDYETYNFDLTGAGAKSQFLFMTRTEGNEDGAILIRKLQITAECDADGVVGIPVGSLETAATSGSFEVSIENEVTYTAVVVPYLVDNNGNILARGQASEPAVLKVGITGIELIEADGNETGSIYYNLRGQKIVNPSKGTPAIKVSGTTATKVIL